MTLAASAPSSSEPTPRGNSPSATVAIHGPVDRAITEAALASSQTFARIARDTAVCRDYIKLATGATSGLFSEWTDSSASILRAHDIFATTLSDSTGLIANRLNRLNQLQTDEGYSELDIPRPSGDSVRAARQLVTRLAASDAILALTKLFPSEDGGIVVRIQTQSRVITITVVNDDVETYHADVWEISNSAGVPVKGREVVIDLHLASPSAVEAFLHALTADDV